MRGLIVKVWTVPGPLGGAVAAAEEKALESARQFLWMDGEFTGRLKPPGPACRTISPRPPARHSGTSWLAKAHRRPAPARIGTAV